MIHYGTDIRIATLRLKGLGHEAMLIAPWSLGKPSVRPKSILFFVLSLHIIDLLQKNLVPLQTLL